jgi:hypothetical protein
MVSLLEATLNYRNDGLNMGPICQGRLDAVTGSADALFVF